LLQEEQIKVDELETEQKKLQSCLAQVQEDYQRLFEATQARSGSAEKLPNLRDQIEKNAQISDLEAKLENLEKKLMNLQGFAFEVRKIAARNTTDDSIIRSRLEYEFRAQTRSWAKDWAMKPFDGNLDTFSLGDLSSEFQKVAVLKHGVSLRTQLQSIDSRVMVDALLSHYLVNRIFRVYFSQQTADQNGGGNAAFMEAGLSKVLMEFYKIFTNGLSPGDPYLHFSGLHSLTERSSG
jgi:hypothetical protein